MITESRKGSVGREGLAFWDTFHPEAEPVTRWLQRTRLQIVLLVAIVVAMALLIAIITGYRLMPPLPFP